MSVFRYLLSPETFGYTLIGFQASSIFGFFLCLNGSFLSIKKTRIACCNHVLFTVLILYQKEGELRMEDIT